MIRGGAIWRLAVAGVLGGAAGAPGREIPVFREYSRPIVFYDEAGERIAAPDISSRQALRDAKVQEMYLGRETLLEIALAPGASIWAKSASGPGLGRPPSAGGNEERRRKTNPDRNWLAGSLALPGLGQSSSNAAASAMGLEAAASRWGWLADEVAARDGDASAQPDEISPEKDEELPGSVPERLLRGEETTGTARAAPAERSPGAQPDGRTADDRLPGAAPKTADARRSSADVAFADGRAFQAATREEGGGMPQTRSMLADITGRVRPNWSPLLASAPDAAAAVRNLAAPDSAPASPAGDSLITAGKISSFKPASGPAGAAFRLPAGGRATGGGWQGGWKAQRAPETLSSSMATYSDQLSEPAPGVPARENLKPRFSNIGTKPAWY